MYISSIFDKCSVLEQTQSRPNHTSKTKVYFNEFVANVLRDNIGLKKSASSLKKNKAVISLSPPPARREFWYCMLVDGA
jgi:hypothetical protein